MFVLLAHGDDFKESKIIDLIGFPLFILFYVLKCLDYKHVGVSPICLAPAEVRRGC